jgi:Cytochrome c7 and related cytochrome c/Class III cytochrome C family
MGIALALLVCSFLFQPATLKGLTTPTGHEPPNESEAQPIPFSHKLHAQFVEDCLLCHEMPEPGWSMGYPSEAICMECHTTIKPDSPFIKKLAMYEKEEKSVPWVRVYHVPDFVYFSHKVHVRKAKLGCEPCHGSVAECDIITKVRPTTMAACMDCHKDSGAPLRCDTCHTPHP